MEFGREVHKAASATVFAMPNCSYLPTATLYGMPPIGTFQNLTASGSIDAIRPSFHKACFPALSV